jgi:hypothetical protein
MSQVIDLCGDSESDDNGEWPNTASIPPLPFSRKRTRDNQEEISSNDDDPRDQNDSENVNATGFTDLTVDLEVAEKAEDSPYRKRRSVMTSGRSVKDCAKIAAAWEVNLNDLVDYRNIHGHCNVPQHCSKNTMSITRWEDRFSELTTYRKIHGHCMLLQLAASTTSSLIGSEPKGSDTGCTEQERHRL